MATSPPRALREDELPGIVDDYRRAARAAVEVAGFDGVEIHAANGYLLDQFLKTGRNARTDRYGGSIENRARLLIDVASAVVEAVGGGRVGIRLSPVTPANDIVDADPKPLFDHVVRAPGADGLAYLHLIEGATGGPREIADRPFDYGALRSTYRNAGGHGAWMVNNGYDGPLAEAALANGADLVAFGKPFISNPDLVRRLREGLPLAPGRQGHLLRRRRQGLHGLPALRRRRLGRGGLSSSGIPAQRRDADGRRVEATVDRQYLAVDERGRRTAQEADGVGDLLAVP